MQINSINTSFYSKKAQMYNFKNNDDYNINFTSLPIMNSQKQPLCNLNKWFLKFVNKIKATSTPPKVLSEVFGPGQKICRDFSDLGGFYSLRMFFKTPIQHYKSIDKTKSNWAKTYKTNDILCIYDKNKQLEKFLIYNWENKAISIFDKKGQVLRRYNPEETHALLCYKSDSTNIHKVLRYNQNIKNKFETEKNILNLSKIFAEHKTDVVSRDMIVYRALDDNALRKILTMNGDEMILEEPSFMSVATKKSSVYQFLNLKNFRHILKIKLQKGTEYINMDEIGHIVVPQAPENELLLNSGKLLIRKNKGSLEGLYLYKDA